MPKSFPNDLHRFYRTISILQELWALHIFICLHLVLLLLKTNFACVMQRYLMCHGKVLHYGFNFFSLITNVEYLVFKHFYMHLLTLQ